MVIEYSSSHKDLGSIICYHKENVWFFRQSRPLHFSHPKTHVVDKIKIITQLETGNGTVFVLLNNSLTYYHE